MPLTRREACMMIPAMLAATGAIAEEKNAPTAALPSAAYNLRDVQAEKSSDHTIWPLFQGKTNHGFHLKLHETELAPGGQPHPPHHHPEEEIFLLREGMVEVTIGGKRTTLVPGGVAYIASNTVHGIRNTSATPARYFVMLLD